jgi:hypothetical protein
LVDIELNGGLEVVEKRKGLRRGNLSENLGENLGEFHRRFRVYRRRVLETIPFERNSDDFVFDTQFLVQAVHFGFRVGDVPVPVRYFDAASSINFRRSAKYGLETVRTVGQLWLHRLGLWRNDLFRPLTDPGQASGPATPIPPGRPG